MAPAEENFAILCVTVVSSPLWSSQRRRGFKLEQVSLSLSMIASLATTGPQLVAMTSTSA
eukprot:2197931-Amphidinium_carterae.1